MAVLLADLLANIKAGLMVDSTGVMRVAESVQSMAERSVPWMVGLWGECMDGSMVDMRAGMKGVIKGRLMVAPMAELTAALKERHLAGPMVALRVESMVE